MIYDPRPQFMPFHIRSNRWACIVAHRRAGKTVAAINELITRALATKKKSARFAYIAPYMVQAKDIAWMYLKQYTDEIRVDQNESELWVEIGNGARIRIYGADNPDRLRGIYLDGVVMDEIADMRPSFWPLIVLPTLTDRNGWACFIGTPKGHNEFYDIAERARNDPSWFFLELTASKSGLLNADQLAEAKRSMSEDQYNQEYECSFEIAIQGAVYGRWMKEAESRITSVPYDPSTQVFTAWDLGFGDSTVIWWAQFVGRELRIIDHYEGNRESISHYAQIVKSKPYNYYRNYHFLPHDANSGQLGTGKSIAKMLTDAGVMNTVLPRPDIDEGIEKVRQLLPLCWFDAVKCKDGIKALKQYHYEFDEVKKIYRQNPRHDWSSHSSDAFRYLAHAAEIIKAGLSSPPVSKTSNTFKSSNSWMG